MAVESKFIGVQAQLSLSHTLSLIALHGMYESLFLYT